MKRLFFVLIYVLATCTVKAQDEFTEIDYSKPVLTFRKITDTLEYTRIALSKLELLPDNDNKYQANISFVVGEKIPESDAFWLTIVRSIGTSFRNWDVYADKGEVPISHKSRNYRTERHIHFIQTQDDLLQWVAPGTYRLNLSMYNPGETDFIEVSVGYAPKEKIAEYVDTLAKFQALFYLKAAERGDDEAMQKIGRMYQEGEYFDKDYRKALDYYMQAAELGNLSACHQIGWIYQTGEIGAIGERPDYDESIKWYRKAAEKGNATSWYSMGFLYERVYENYIKARECYSKAVDLKHENAARALKRLNSSDGTDELVAAQKYYDEQRYDEAMEWYLKAAEKKNPEAMYNIGSMLEEGYRDADERENTPVNRHRAHLKMKQWYQRAAANSEVAATALQRINSADGTDEYEEGSKFYNDKKYAEALEYYTKAANKQNSSAMNSIGDMHEYGKLGTKDLAEAKKWYVRSAEQGDEDGIKAVERVNSLDGTVEFEKAKPYIDENNYTEALKLCRRAADKNHVDAICTVAGFYEKGTGVAKNLDEAKRWYKRAADKGNAEAIAALERLSSTPDDVSMGEGIADANEPRDSVVVAVVVEDNGEDENKVALKYYGDKKYADALKWFRKAADKGMAGAMFNLAAMYEKGEGAAKNTDSAKEWYSKAAAAGDANAKQALRRLGSGGINLASELENIGGYDEYKVAVDYYREKNYANALKWFRKAADLRHPAAMYNVGYMYEKGEGVELSLPEASKWYRSADDEGDANAADALKRIEQSSKTTDAADDGTDEIETGRKYYGEKKYDEAVKWFRKAAEKGNINAMFNLGAIYENDIKDKLEALKWYRKAAEAGDENAKKAVDRMLSSL